MRERVTDTSLWLWHAAGDATGSLAERAQGVFAGAKASARRGQAGEAAPQSVPLFTSSADAPGGHYVTLPGQDPGPGSTV